MPDKSRIFKVQNERIEYSIRVAEVFIVLLMHGLDARQGKIKAGTGVYKYEQVCIFFWISCRFRRLHILWCISG